MTDRRGASGPGDADGEAGPGVTNWFLLHGDRPSVAAVVVLGAATVVGLLVAVSLTLVYRTESVSVPAEFLPILVTLGMAAVVSPLAVFVALIVRAAAIAFRAISVGPFVPPSE